MEENKRLIRAQEHLRVSAALKEELASNGLPAVLAAVDIIVDCFQSGKKVFLCGNGGSAADCQHVAAEFMSRLTKDFDRPALPAIALTTDTSFLTAFANDCGYEGVFERQIDALGREGDVLIGISTSGSSPNVLRAVAAARRLRLRTIALVGEGGELESLVDCAIKVPSRNTHHIQESLLSLEHILCILVEQALFKNTQAAS
jgi:D-sedoheptulose 7-phosphate isomerase